LLDPVKLTTGTLLVVLQFRKKILILEKREMED